MVGAERKVHDTETGKTRITKVDTAYLKQSILEPNALIVDGYAKDLMPPVGAYLTDSQIGELINYIKNVSNPSVASLKQIDRWQPFAIGAQKIFLKSASDGCKKSPIPR